MGVLRLSHQTKWELGSLQVQTNLMSTKWQSKTRISKLIQITLLRKAANRCWTLEEPEVLELMPINCLRATWWIRSEAWAWTWIWAISIWVDLVMDIMPLISIMGVTECQELWRWEIWVPLKPTSSITTVFHRNRFTQRQTCLNSIKITEFVITNLFYY